ncbi:MAG: hypothetical protein QF516_07615, partial [Pirellulaceae bacterium]|nr:hypothetical protein [Pirellulaceae bacterium]
MLARLREASSLAPAIHANIGGGRPKSCIGEKVRPDDFWSEEMYAQKMRESAGWQYDQREVRPQSRGARNSISRSGTAAPALPEFARE